MTRKGARGALGSADPMRPSRLAHIIGQGEAVTYLSKAVAAARGRGEMPSHMLLAGPAGTGKTTLAGAVANEIGAKLTVLYGVNLKDSRKDLMPTLMTMTKGRHVLFIDEIHRMWRPVQETLFPVMEDRMLDYGGGIRFPLGELCVIGATTDPERLLTPLLDRFPNVLRLRLYRDDELVAIAEHAAKVLHVDLDDAAALAIARASEGVPRVAIKLVKASRDYAKKGNVPLDVVTWLLSQKVLIWRTEGRSARDA